MVTAAWPAISTTRAVVRGESERDLADESLGIQVHYLAPEERDAWRVATADVTTQLIGKIGGRSAEIYERIQAVRQEFRSAGSR